MGALVRPRILLVSARFPPDVGGIETHVAEVAPRLAKMGLDVRVLTTDRSGALPAHDLADGVPVARVRAYPRSRDYYFAPDLSGAIRRTRPDLVHVQGYHTLVAPMAMATARAVGSPYVVSFHSGGHPSALRRRVRSLQRLALRPLLMGAARLIAVSRYEMELFRQDLRLGRHRFELVRNGSSLPEPRYAEPSTGPVVVSVGRLERYKGHGRLVRAWPSVLATTPDAHLRIIGAGPGESELHAEIERLRLGDRVTVGSIPASDRQAMADAVGSARLFALLSDYEAHPVAVMEALAVGTPALVARTSGLTELVDDGLAAGVDADASDGEVAEAILRELRQPPEKRRLHLPTWDDCANTLASVYREVLGGPR